MSIELDLLSLLGTFESYNKYFAAIEKLSKTGALTETSRQVVDVMTEYYEKYGDTRPVDWNSIATWAAMLSKVGGKLSPKHKQSLQDVCSLLSTYTPTSTSKEVVTRLQAIDFAEKALPILEEVAASGDPDKLSDLKSMLETAVADVSSVDSEPFVKDDIDAILSHHVTGGGVSWRYDEMNVMVGPLRAGDLAIVFGRPEIGKTSFVISELTNFATQIGPDDKVVIFNNEEAGDKLLLRCYTTALNLDANKLSRVKDKKDAMVKALGGDKVLVYDDANTTVRDVERVCEAYKPKVIVFNVLDKVHGFTKMDEVARLRRIAQWARELGKKHEAIIICVCQADGTAEGEKYIFKNQIYGSKTGVPGEADVIIGVGYDPNEADIRYFHVSKNKLAGGPKSDPARSHGFGAAKFDKLTGRYVNAT